MSSKPTLYYMLESPPCRTVLAIARLLNVELELKTVDLTKKEQLDAEFVKINPFHVVPTLQDSDGFVIWESRAIAAYLIESRAPESELYPAGDLKRRATIDKLLQYDLGTFYRALSDYVYGLFTTGKFNEDKLPRLIEVLETLNAYISLQPSGFLTGASLTLADLSLYFSLTLLDVAPAVTLGPTYPAIAAFFAKVDKAIEPINADGKFQEGRDNMQIFAKMLVEKAQAEQN